MKKLKFKEKYKQPIFAITKIVYLIWTIFLAGALDKWKSGIVESNDHIIYYAIFWILLAGVGGIFSVFWSAKNNDDIASVLEIIQSSIIIPSAIIYVFLIVTLAITSRNLNLGATIFFIAIPIIVGISTAWKMSMKKSGIIDILI